MNSIVKVALGFFLLVVLLSVFVPFIDREMDERANIDRGVKVLGSAFIKVRRDKGNAILWARPRNQRGYRISVDGNRDYERNLELPPFNAPLPISVKLASRLAFLYRHSSFQCRVTSINAKGVKIEVGRYKPSPFFRNQTVFLPWK